MGMFIHGDTEAPHGSSRKVSYQASCGRLVWPFSRPLLLEELERFPDLVVGLRRSFRPLSSEKNPRARRVSTVSGFEVLTLARLFPGEIQIP